MYLIFEPGKQLVPRVGIIGPVRVWTQGSHCCCC
jgi:hypothetical protein